MKKSASKGVENSGFDNRQIDWELRPGGMLVQKRDTEGDPSGPMIKIKISHGSYHYEITVPAQSTFGNFSLLKFYINFIVLKGYFISFDKMGTSHFVLWLLGF